MDKILDEIKERTKSWIDDHAIAIEWLAKINQSKGFSCYQALKAKYTDNSIVRVKADNEYRDGIVEVAALTICAIIDFDFRPTETIDYIFQEIKEERKRQDKKFGEQNHTPLEWLSILDEEVGEAAKAANDYHFGFNMGPGNYREELVQVLAVCVNALESFDRGKWRVKQ